MNHPTTAPEISADLERRAVFIEASSPAELATTISKEQATWTNLIFDYARRQKNHAKSGKLVKSPPSSALLLCFNQPSITLA